MEIGLVAYVLYAAIILIWISLSEDGVGLLLISSSQLQDWRLRGTNLIVFELHPENSSPPPAGEHDDCLPVTPAGLQALVGWIPSGSTVVLCNHGVSCRCVHRIQQLLIVREVAQVYWLGEAKRPAMAGRSLRRL